MRHFTNTCKDRVCGLGSSKVGITRKWNKVSLEKKSGKCRTQKPIVFALFWLLSWGILRLSLQFLCMLGHAEAERKLLGYNSGWGRKGYLRLKKI